MKKIFKKLSCVLIAIFIFNSIFIVNASDDEIQESTNYRILSQILEMDDALAEYDISDFIVTSINAQNDANTFSYGNSEKAFQLTVDLSNGNKDVITIIPFKIDDSGKLINSFSDQVNVTRGSVPITLDDVDITVTITTNFTQYTNHVNWYPFWRPIGVSARWTSNTTQSRVTYLNVQYGTTGSLHYYPECINYDNFEDYQLQESYTIMSEISKSMPTKNTTYTDNNSLPSNRAIFLKNYWDNMEVYFDISYSGNGTTDSTDGYYIVVKG